VSTLTIILKIRSLNCALACPFTKETKKFHKIQIVSTNCAHIFVWMICVCMRARAHTHIHTYMHIYIYTYTHTNTHMSSVTMAWYTLRLQWEGTPPGYGGDLWVLSMQWWTVNNWWSSTWGLGEDLTTPYHKKINMLWHDLQSLVLGQLLHFTWSVLLDITSHCHSNLLSLRLHALQFNKLQLIFGFY